MSAFAENIRRVSLEVEAWPLHDQRSAATFDPDKLRRSADAVLERARRDAEHRRAVAAYMESSGVETLTVSQIIRCRP